MTMIKKSVLSAALALAALATVSLSTAPADAAVVTHIGYVNTAAPVAVNHYGYTRVTPYGVKHVGYTRVW
jgi:predicted secreted protein